MWRYDCTSNDRLTAAALERGGCGDWRQCAHLAGRIGPRPGRCRIARHGQGVAADSSRASTAPEQHGRLLGGQFVIDVHVLRVTRRHGAITEQYESQTAPTLQRRHGAEPQPVGARRQILPPCFAVKYTSAYGSRAARARPSASVGGNDSSGSSPRTAMLAPAIGRRSRSCTSTTRPGAAGSELTSVRAGAAGVSTGWTVAGKVGTPTGTAGGGSSRDDSQTHVAPSDASRRMAMAIRRRGT